MLKKIIIIFFLLSLKIAFSLELNCGLNNYYGKCILGEKCTCLIDECKEGNLFIFSNNITNPLCIPPIKENTAQINLDICVSDETRLDIIAICNDEMSEKKTIEILKERPPACVWNQTNFSCQINTDPIANKCPSNYLCIPIEEGICECKRPVTTTQPAITQIQIQTTMSVTTILTTTTFSIEPCPYECCRNLEGYEDLSCDEGYVCCSVGNEYICKKDSCFEEKKAKGFSGWIIILIIIVLSVIGGAVYYFSKTKVNLQNKYRF
ncbi:MAG: hypothetical protein QXJ06_05730 [Candidatus Aenigmatarchaeota archaeon]